MKRLHAVRLVQWYHFVDETFRLAGSCLLLGDNGSGKSTVLDAIQLALVADLSEVRFNKAANEQSRRGLYGYVRHKLGSEDEQRPGFQRYGRGGCSSYVMLEFRDDADPGSDFVAGVVLEATESDSNVHKSHFVLPGLRVDAVPAVQPGDLVRTLRDFRSTLKNIPGARSSLDVGTYRDELRHRLGVLPPSFHRLLVKALSFIPLGRVKQFVFDYLLEPLPIDTAALQSNLDHYKKLEGEAKQAERRISALDAICAEGERIGQQRAIAESHRYTAIRAERELGEAAVEKCDAAVAEAERERGALAEDEARRAKQLEFLGAERDRVRAVLERSDTFRDVRALEQQITRAENDLEHAKAADDLAREILKLQDGALDLLQSVEAQQIRAAASDAFVGDDVAGQLETPQLVQRLRETLQTQGALGGRDLGTWQRRLGRACDSLRAAQTSFQQRVAAARAEGAALQEERRALESGRQRYPEGPEALLHLLRAKLKATSREPKPLCELIDVPNERWRDAVEGYLNTKRFDVLVAPEDFPRALSLYDRHKRDYMMPGARHPVFIGGAGLVDMERVLGAQIHPERRSLAEQIETTDALARAYCDFLLGDVVCVDDEKDLRRYRRSITDSVMVYQGHVARQTRREVYERHYIGNAARLRRLDAVDRRLGDLSDLIAGTAKHLLWLGDALEAADRARTQAARLGDLLDRAQNAPTLRLNIVRLRDQLGRIDRKDIEALERERLLIDEELGREEKERLRVSGELHTLEERLRHLEPAAGKARESLGAVTTRIDGTFATLAEDARAQYDAHYTEERTRRGAAEVREVFERQAKNIESRVDKMILNLVKLKTTYVNDYGFSADPSANGFEEFSTERDHWKESALPDYRRRIEEAKRQALEQLTEDVIFRLRANLLLVEKQIDELNRALKDEPFGSERYQFTTKVADDHRPFYDLIMDAGRFESDSLFGAAVLEDGSTAKGVLAGLFDRLIESEAATVKTELDARADYREYYEYDLRIHHADGTSSLYDKVAGDKSGGETQTPYYIAILASMYRLYRSRDGQPSCGLVLLDEAFGKMDEKRIAATLAFARRLGLQLVLATPKERSDLVAPQVETSIFIHKDPMTGEPTVVDVTKEFEADGGVVDARGAGRAATASARGT